MITEIDPLSAVTASNMTDGKEHTAAGRDIAIHRFRELMKAAGGRFAEMAAEEEGEIVDYLAIFAPRLWQPSEGMAE